METVIDNITQHLTKMMAYEATVLQLLSHPPLTECYFCIDCTLQLAYFNTLDLTGNIY